MVSKQRGNSPRTPGTQPACEIVEGSAAAPGNRALILASGPNDPAAAGTRNLRGQQCGPRDRERDALVVAEYADGGVGATFQSVGDKVGLSSERVRQIVERWEGETKKRIPRAPERRRIAKREADAARKSLGPPSLAQRLLAHARADPVTDCWEWTGPFMHPNGRTFARFKALGEQFANRVAFRLWCGPIPPGHVILQACGGRFCINPFHLFTASRGEAVRLWTAGRKAPPMTHCKRGHALTPDNTTWNTASALRDGARIMVRTRLCRICARERHRRNYTTPPPRPPLPEDEHERDVEMIIRRIEYARVADRPAVLWRELERTESESVRVPALEGERWEEYRARTGRSGPFSDWLASRILGHARVKKALQARRGRKPRDAEPPP